VMLRAVVFLALASSVSGTVKCVDPSRTQPGYCCNGIAPEMEFIDNCECNHDWTPEQCTCRGIVLKDACHACMVHLPASNKWDLTAFSETELFGQCEDCVGRCTAEIKEGMCKDYTDDFFAERFPVGEPYETICTVENLKETLFREDYPLLLKRALYNRPTMYRSGNKAIKDTRYDWKVPGTGTTTGMNMNKGASEEIGWAMQGLSKEEIARKKRKAGYDPNKILEDRRNNRKTSAEMDAHVAGGIAKGKRMLSKATR